jgi:two-component system, OmpR family, sensor histidine kinase KdpD
MTLYPMNARNDTLQRHALAAAACLLTALVATPLRHYFDLVNIVMLFLLTVFLVAVRLGREPAILASFLNVALFDFFFVPPRLTFAVADTQYLLTFAVMLAVALVTGHLAASLKTQAEIARLREQRTRALYEMAKTLSGALTVNQVFEVAQKFVLEIMRGHCQILLPDAHGALRELSANQVWYEPHVAEMAYHGESRPMRDSDGVCYCPLAGSTQPRGVLVVGAVDGNPFAHEQSELLHALSSLLAIAVERIHYVEVAQQAQVDMASERLRNSILSALSHDLRTPLTVLVGLADSLALGGGLNTRQLEAAATIRDQSLRLNGLAENLLDMVRLHSDRIRLRREWQPLEEVVGAAIKLLEQTLSGHAVSVRLPADLPLLEFDAVLMERVLCNLLENAAKYTPPATPIEIAAAVVGDMAEICVRDHGSGIPQQRQQQIFDMFVRGTPESSLPGVGLGLAICKAIVEAHGGTIHVTNHPQGGAEFVFSLPLGVPPQLVEEPLT